MGMILRIASSRIVGQGDIVGRSGYFSLNLSANSVMRGRLDARRTLKSLVADLRKEKKAIAIHNHSFQERIRKNDSIYIDIDFWNIEKKLSLPPSLDDGLFLKWEIAKRRFIKHIVKDSQGFHKLDVENEDDLRLSKRTFGQLYCMYILAHNETMRHEK